MNNELSEQMINKLRKELMWTRVFSMITSLLLVCVLVGGVSVFGKVQQYEQQVKTYVEEITPVLAQLSQLDVEELNESLMQMNRVVESVDWAMLNDSIASVDWEKVSGQLADLDVDAINSAIEGLDTRELSEALENLNKAADTLGKIGDSLSAFTSRFGS